jgi:hypothetical protein
MISFVRATQDDDVFCSASEVGARIRSAVTITNMTEAQADSATHKSPHSCAQIIRPGAAV